ncbi:MAG TPA: glycosyltransferase family 2 protein [Gemmatimonadaceae bacterium]|nr:glycosyltransferase family 2 protein [Gemmatimonadaceae bacterium]
MSSPRTPAHATVPVVSIGLPVYNGEATVAAAIESLLAQSFGDFELIISDNASTDATEAICRRLAAGDPRVRYVRQPGNRGPIANFEYVLAEARAALFMWAASDDRWEPEFLADNVRLLEREPAAVSSVSLVSQPSIAEPGTAPLRGGFVSKVRRLIRENAGNSRYYGVWRTPVLREAMRRGSGHFIASDWAIIISACRHGDFVTTDRVLMTRGGRGASTAWRRQMALFGCRGIDRVLPLWAFTRWLARNLTPWELLRCLDVILLRNLSITVHYAIEVAKQPRDPYRAHVPVLPPTRN